MVQWLTEGSATITLVRTKTITQYKDSAFNIIKINPLPPEPTISGIFETCRNNVESYTGTQIPGGSLLWSASGGLIIGDVDKSSVQVQWLSDASGTITLTQTLDSSGCRSSSYQTVLINPLPSTIISGPTTVLDNSPRTYSVEESQGNIYKWSAENGQIVGTESSSTVEIIWDREHAGEGKLKVVINSADGCTDSSEINVLFVIISVPENAKQANYSVKLYPNPSSGLINIDITAANSAYFVLEIYNAYGEKIKVLYSGIIEHEGLKAAWDGTDNVGRNVASGIYFVLIKNQHDSILRSILIL
jgi:hypothetical protein